MCLQLLGIVNYGGHFEKNENPHRNKRLFPIQIGKMILYQLQFIISINYEKKKAMPLISKKLIYLHKP